MSRRQRTGHATTFVLTAGRLLGLAATVVGVVAVDRHDSVVGVVAVDRHDSVVGTLGTLRRD
ncbi:hypothetical protein [Salinigranum halophilum]|uniref:hypothetical protein n=1 Tax=Salinigranum halophilum TaxID=2565931 RepID=UPI0010A8A6F8|nr:hypothetical protein [Salinigranum halophilum]